ncbi:hypothetical protein ACQPXH_12090 [Nocardia sp. CA-135953]
MSITRLTDQWQDAARAFAERDLSGTEYVAAHTADSRGWKVG